MSDSPRITMEGITTLQCSLVVSVGVSFKFLCNSPSHSGERRSILKLTTTGM